MNGIAEYDARRDNFLARITVLERELENLKRWAAPVTANTLPNPPGIHAWRTSSQSIATGTATDVTALTDSQSDYGLALEGGNIINLRRDSAVEYYSVTINAKWSNSSTVGDRTIEIGARHADTGTWSYLTLDTRAAIASDKTAITITYQHWLNTSNALKFRVTQTSGGNLNLELFLVDVVLVKSSDQPTA